MPFHRPGAHLYTGESASLPFFTGTGFGDSEAERRLADSQRTLSALRVGQEAREVFAGLVGSGTLDLFPDLHFISVENNANWLAGLMAAVDKTWTRGPGQPESFLFAQHDMISDPDLDPLSDIFDFKWSYSLRPSDYLRRQVHATFQDDPAAIALRDYTGVECLLWGADYPHAEGTFPETQAALDLQFAGVPEDDMRAMVGGTLSKLYNIRVPASI